LKKKCEETSKDGTSGLRQISVNEAGGSELPRVLIDDECSTIMELQLIIKLFRASQHLIACKCFLKSKECNFMFPI